MGVRGKVLDARKAILLAGTVSIAAIPGSQALAADQPVFKAPVPEVVSWYFFGGFEAGVRFVDEPPSGFGRAPPPVNWLTPLTTQSRAKFEEYGEIPRGLFLDWFNFQAGTTDGRYAFDVWGRNVGLNNQSYNLDAAAIGYHYLTVGWDQTPHLISTSAKSIFTGAGSTFLRVADPVQAALESNLPNAAAAAPPAASGLLGQTARANIENIINGAVSPLELGTQRDKASIAYRSTPTSDWDFVVDYSHEHRTGTRPVGVPYGWGTGPGTPRPTNVVEAPQPIDDTTQNVNARAEYVGSLWGMRWTTNVKYSGSFYHNDAKVLDIENPFCITCNVLVGANRGPNILRLGLAPDNDANALTWNTAVDLPFLKSRYVSTLQYNVMRQNDAFVNTGTNGLVAPPVTLLGVQVGSLDGKVDTFLWNNLYTAQLTKDLKLTVRGRHYDVNNHTPSLHIENWIFGDSGCASGAPSPAGVCSIGNARQSLPISYTKDNVSAELNWRPARWATLGGGYFFERYDRKFRDVNVTDEHMGKVFVNITPIENVVARAQYLYAERRYDTYNTEEFVEHPGIQFSEVVSNLRRFDVANRNRHKAEAALDWSPFSILTVSPNFGLRWDDYPDPVANPLGVRSDHSWNAGLEISALLAPTLRIMASYNYEDRRLDMAGGSGGANFNTGNPFTGCPTSAALNPDHIIGTACTWSSDIQQRYHTFMAAADWKAIPSRFDLRLEYLHVRASEANATTPCSAPLFVGATAVGTNCNGLQTTGSPPTLVDPASVNFGQFPAERNTFDRFNVIGRYYVDPSIVRQMGWSGDVTIKVRYTYERNQNTNWATDNLTPYVPTPDTTELTGAGRSIFLAAYNPNYTAQLIALSAVVKW
jgi:MtrB/PioB family decaheme-associated outer membrane protein